MLPLPWETDSGRELSAELSALRVMLSGSQGTGLAGGGGSADSQGGFPCAPDVPRVVTEGGEGLYLYNLAAAQCHCWPRLGAGTLASQLWAECCSPQQRATRRMLNRQQPGGLNNRHLLLRRVWRLKAQGQGGSWAGRERLSQVSLLGS